MRLFKRSRITKAEHNQQHQQATQPTSGPLHEKHRAEEYVYVPSRFGYDYAPPSLLAPSHSVDNSVVQPHLSKMVYAEEPRVSDLSGNTASLSSYYKKEVQDAVRQHQEYETKYHQKTPQVSSNSVVLQHQEYEAKYKKTPQQEPNNSSKQVVDFSSRTQKPGGSSSSSKSHWRPSEQEHRQRLSQQQKIQRAEKLRELAAVRGLPPGYYEEREQEAPSHPYRSTTPQENRETVERVPNLRDVPSIDSGLQYTRERSRQSRYSMGDSVASSQRSNIQRRKPPAGMPHQQSVPSSQRNQARSQPPAGISQSEAISQRSQDRRQQPTEPRIPPKGLVATHSIDTSTITTLPEIFEKPVEEGTYYRQHEARRNAVAAGRPPMHYQRILSHQPSDDQGAGSQVSARERKRNIEQSYIDYLMRERGWVPTAFVAADVMHASEKNKIGASKKLLRNPAAVPSVNSAPNAVTNNEPKRAPIAPIVLPKKKGLLKRLFGRGESSKILKHAKQTQAAITGSKKQPPRIQVDPPSKGTIRGVVNPAKIGKSASTKEMSSSLYSGSKTKIYCKPIANISNDNNTPLSMAAARSITSSHYKYGSKDVGIQLNASFQSKASSNKESLQQKQSSASSANPSTAPNKIFFPETSEGDGKSTGSSRHPTYVSTKFYSGGGTKLQSQQPSNSGSLNAGSGVRMVRSSSIDSRQSSSKRSNGSATSYSRALTNSMITNSMVSSRRSSGSRISGQVFKSTSQYGLQTIRSGDSDWKPDPGMPDPWVEPQARPLMAPQMPRPRASNVIIRGTHRGSSSRRPYTEGSPTTLTSLFNFSCI